LEEGEERAERSTQQYNVIAVVDGFGEGVFVGIEAGKNAREESGMGYGA